MKNGILKRIKVIAMDVDGVMTDGRMVYGDDGRELKFFDSQDGYAVVRARAEGLKIAAISGKGGPAVMARLKELKYDKVYLNVPVKIMAYENMLKIFGVSDKEVCYIGDDIPDHTVLLRAGFGVAVANAAAEVKSAADLVTRRPGGRGAVREVVEKILKARGRWGAE